MRDSIRREFAKKERLLDLIRTHTTSKKRSKRTRDVVMLKQSFLCPCEWNEARLYVGASIFFFFFFFFFLLRRSCRHGRRKQKRPKGFRACSRLSLSMVCLCALPENFPSVFVYYHFTCVFVLLLLLLLFRTARWNEIQRLFFFFLSELLHA